MAREAYLLMIERYPSHPQTADAYRWLIRYSSSGEARQRMYARQGAVFDQITGKTEENGSGGTQATLKVDRDKPQQTVSAIERASFVATEKRLPNELREWHQAALNLEAPLAAFGRLFVGDPGLQFCLNASRRATGDFDTPRKWCTQYVADHAEGPWRDAAQAELWLTRRQGPPPKPALICPHLDDKPFLDGQLDDPCWQNVKPVTLKNAVGETQKEFPTQAWMACDGEFLYLALRCQNPVDRYVPPVKVRQRDTDVSSFDHVTLMLDLDRDYTTTYNLHVDQRGCVSDDCWGDMSWNPRWFVACKSDKNYWQIEAAIPLVELTQDRIAPDAVWAFNIVRTIPGRGVQAFSLPADAVPRPEGMGLLMFEAKDKLREGSPRPRPPKAQSFGCCDWSV